MSLSQSQIALSNYPYHKCSLSYTLDSLQRLGAQAIEFVCCEPHFYFDDLQGGDLSALKRALSDRGLKIICLTPPTMEYPMNLASENIATRKKTVDYLVRAIQYANELEVPMVSLNVGQTTLDGDVGAAWERSVESLRYLTFIAESYGTKLAVYVTGTRKSSLLDSIASAARLKRDIASLALGFVADTVYLARMGQTPESFSAELGVQNILLTHFADCKDSTLHLAPGEGNLKLEDTLESLELSGYEGYLSLNMRGSRDPYVYEEEPERCMRAGARWLRDHLN